MTKRKLTLRERALDYEGATGRSHYDTTGPWYAGYKSGAYDGWLAGYRAGKRDAALAAQEKT